MTSLCTSQWRRRYVSNETPNNVSVERRQDVSVVRLHEVLFVCHDDVSRGRNNDQYVSTKPQINLKWSTQQRLSGTSPKRLSGIHDVALVRLYDVS